MAWKLSQFGYPVQVPTAVQEHAMQKWWPLSCSETFWTSGTRQLTSLPQFFWAWIIWKNWQDSQGHSWIRRANLQPTCTRTPCSSNIRSHVAIQNSTSELWDIYGIVTALTSLRRYFVKLNVDVCWSGTVAFFTSEFQYPLEHQTKNLEHKSPS